MNETRRASPILLFIGLAFFAIKDIMDNKINLDLNLFKIILDQEAKKLTGKTMKRFEISKDMEIVKREVKELQYEAFRDILDMLQNGKVIFQIESKDLKKE